MSGVAARLAHERALDNGYGTNEKTLKFLDQDFEAIRDECLQSGSQLPQSAGGGVEETHGAVRQPSVHQRRSHPDGHLPGSTWWLLAAIVLLTLNEQILCGVVPVDKSSLEKYMVFHFQLRKFGEYVNVVEDLEFVHVFLAEGNASRSEKAYDNVVDDKIEADNDETDPSEDHIDPSFRRLFLQLAGEDKEISAFELCNILQKVISKQTDIKSDGFSMETCRIIVDLLDSDGTGKLGLREFNILWPRLQNYQRIYRSIDVDRSGTMNAYEMRKALEEAGFRLNTQLHNLLVSRFANNEDLSIDFDNFVRCLLRLEMMIKLFRQMDTGSSGEVPLDISSSCDPDVQKILTTYIQCTKNSSCPLPSDPVPLHKEKILFYLLKFKSDS